MGAVMIRCPDTGREIPTGLMADRDSFRATPVFFGRVYCPLCRSEHEWFAKEAWVGDSPGLAPAAPVPTATPGDRVRADEAARRRKAS